MNLQAATGRKGYRFPHVFKFETQLIVSVQGVAAIAIARDAATVEETINTFLNGGSGNQDGLLLDSRSTTAPIAQPFIFVWSGELWYAAHQDNSQFSLVIATETSQRN